MQLMQWNNSKQDTLPTESTRLKPASLSNCHIKATVEDFPSVPVTPNTISFFGEELNKYENKRAYLCNSRRPFVPSIHKIAQQQFMQKNKIVLRIKTEIEELK